MENCTWCKIAAVPADGRYQIPLISIQEVLKDLVKQGIIAAVVSRRHVPLALLETLSRSEVIFARACALLGFIVQLDLYTRVKDHVVGQQCIVLQVQRSHDLYNAGTTRLADPYQHVQRRLFAPWAVIVSME